MNVNPFSYLIEKLKSKVSKSGDTMTGILDIQRPSGNNAFLKTTNTTNNLVMGVGIDGDGITRGIYDYGINNWLFYTNGTNVYANNTKVPYNGGELALKSDIPVIHAGRYDAGTIPTNTEQTYTITFPYTNNPICSVLLEVPYGYGGQLIYHIQRYDNTSMTVDIKNNANVGLGILFHWIVVEAQ